MSLEGPDSGSIAIMVFNPSVREVLSWGTWPIRDMPFRKTHTAGVPSGNKITNPISAVQGTNDTSIAGYTGPCLQAGEMLRYLFRVCCLDDFL